MSAREREKDIYIARVTETEGERERQADRQTDREERRGERDGAYMKNNSSTGPFGASFPYSTLRYSYTGRPA